MHCRRRACAALHLPLTRVLPAPAPCPALPLCPTGRQYNLLNGESITADLYVSAMPVDIVKKLMPEPWGRMDFFK